MRGIDPGSIGNVIDLIKNIEVGQFKYLENPDLLTRLPSDEIIGLGPGGEPYVKGPDLNLESGLDPSVRDALKGPPIYPGLVVGREFAKTLHAYVGDEITLVSPLGDLGPMGVMPRSKIAQVAAIFDVGMYEYDNNFVYIPFELAQVLYQMRDSATGVDILIADPQRVDDVRARIAGVLEARYRLSDWQRANASYFNAG